MDGGVSKRKQKQIEFKKKQLENKAINSNLKPRDTNFDPNLNTEYIRTRLNELAKSFPAASPPTEEASFSTMESLESLENFISKRMKRVKFRSFFFQSLDVALIPNGQETNSFEVLVLTLSGIKAVEIIRQATELL